MLYSHLSNTRRVDPSDRVYTVINDLSWILADQIFPLSLSSCFLLTYHFVLDCKRYLFYHLKCKDIWNINLFGPHYIIWIKMHLLFYFNMILWLASLLVRISIFLFVNLFQLSIIAKILRNLQNMKVSINHYHLFGFSALNFNRKIFKILFDLNSCCIYKIE